LPHQGRPLQKPLPKTCFSGGNNIVAVGGLNRVKKPRKATFGEVFAMSHYPTPRERAKRAFRAYIDVLETADWLKGEMHGPLLLYDLSMGDFRLLEMLHREGAMFAPDIARKRRLHKQAVAVIVKRLSKRGLVLRKTVKLPSVEFQRAHLPVSRRDEGREGIRTSVVGLTKLGKKFIGNVLPRHTKMVKALMRALDGRDQDTLSRLCRKLRAGNPVRYFAELTHEYDDEYRVES
jgi:DNA-binding MarR family transcriptional regulator